MSYEKELIKGGWKQLRGLLKQLRDVLAFAGGRCRSTN